ARSKAAMMRKTITTTAAAIHRSLASNAARQAAPSTGGVIKPHRYRSGTVALREIRRFQMTTDPLIPKAAFSKLVREITQDGMTDIRWAAAALAALQEAAEAHVVEVLKKAGKLAIHSKRVTIKPDDILLAASEMHGGDGVVKVDALAKASTVPYKGSANNVTVSGAGLQKFVPGRPAKFVVDTTHAGSSLISVTIGTAKGPCDELSIKHEGDGRYSVTYVVKERAKGTAAIKYGDAEIHGSPFSLDYY
ncbi:hypothetical protein PFISCL1PPCAC_13978, partial [Pristionchus fissidentatus]